MYTHVYPPTRHPPRQVIIPDEPEDDYSRMTVVELRAKCVSRKLSQVGLKQQLILVRGLWPSGVAVVHGWLCCCTHADLGFRSTQLAGLVGFGCLPSAYTICCSFPFPVAQRLREYDAKLVAEAEEHAHFEVRWLCSVQLLLLLPAAAVGICCCAAVPPT